MTTASAAVLIHGTGVAEPIELRAFAMSIECPTASGNNESFCGFLPNSFVAEQS